MKIPKSFRIKKNLEEKTQDLLDGKVIKPIEDPLNIEYLIGKQMVEYLECRHQSKDYKSPLIILDSLGNRFEYINDIFRDVIDKLKTGEIKIKGVERPVVGWCIQNFYDLNEPRFAKAFKEAKKDKPDYFNLLYIHADVFDKFLKFQKFLEMFGTKKPDLYVIKL